MLYRRIRKGESTGFVTTDVDLLQEGADNAAGLINAVLWQRADKLEKQEQTRRNQIYQEISAADDQTIESKVCQAVLRIFQALEVDFYRVNERGSALEGIWIAGARRESNDAKMEKSQKPSGNHADLIGHTIGRDSDKRPYRVATRVVNWPAIFQRTRPPENSRSHRTGVRAVDRRPKVRRCPGHPLANRGERLVRASSIARRL